jgi:outer membrane protein assembly factor BamB
MQALFAGGDGWLYGFEASSGELLWKFDLNPKKATPYKPGGGGERCFPISSPVVVDGLCYIAVGQEPDDGPGAGHLWCIDITKRPTNKDRDLSPVNDNLDPKAAANSGSGLVWHHGGPAPPNPKDEGRDYVFGRTISLVVIHGGLVYAPELAGYLYCLDAKTGQKVWEYDLEDSTWCSAFYADGKVYLGTDGDLFIFSAGRELKKPARIDMGAAVKVAPVAANGVLYVNTGGTLYALAKR